MKVLVTGGAGFIGSHLVDRLLALGHQVRVFDNLTTGKRENLSAAGPHVELLVGDVRDAGALDQAARGVELVFHLAAIVSVQRSVEQPLETQAVNLGGTLNVLTAAHKQGVRRVVLASSAAVYGTGGNGATSEREPTLPESPYGLEKLGSEHYLRIWHQLHGLETLALRYFNVFGPRQDPSSPYSGVLSIFADRMLRGVVPIIYGDGEQTRDFVYVSNIVEANCCAAFGATGHGVFNVGCGVSTSLNQLFRQMASVLGDRLPAGYAPSYAPGRAGDIRHSLADISQARSTLGYRPLVQVAEGLKPLLGALQPG